MTITRTFCGQEVKIDLTALELIEAYNEQQKIHDFSDVEGYLNNQYFEDNDLTEQERTELLQLLPEIVQKYRWQEDNHRTSDWWDSAETAIVRTKNENKQEGQ